MVEIDPFPISELQNRYDLSSKQTVYDRINKLNIQPVARGKISSEQLDKLDKLDKWIKEGRKIEDFVNQQTGNNGQGQRSSTHQGKTVALASNTFNSSNQLEEIDGISPFVELVHQIAAAVKPQLDPLQHYESLERAARNGWLLTTQEVRQLIGVKPHDSTFSRGSFTFVRSGKIGRCTAWRVVKVQ